MNSILIVFFIILYSIFMLGSYFIIIKRLKSITKRNITYTKVGEIQNIYNSLRTKIIILFLLGYILSIFTIIKFAYV